MSLWGMHILMVGYWHYYRFIELTINSHAKPYNLASRRLLWAWDPCACCSVLVYFLQVQRGKMEIHLQASVKPHLDLACAKLNTTQEQLKMSQQATNNLTEKVFALENQWTLFQQKLELSRLADGKRVDALTRKLDTFQCQYEERFRELEIGVKTVKETVKDDSNRLGVLEKKGIRPLSRPSYTPRLNQSLCETSNDNVNGTPYLPARYSPRRASEIYSYSSLVNGTSADKADATDLPIYTPPEIGVKTIKKTVEDDSNRLGVLEKQGTRPLSRPSYTRLNQSLCETSNDNVNGTSYLPAMYCSRRGRPERYTSRFQTY